MNITTLMYRILAPPTPAEPFFLLSRGVSGLRNPAYFSMLYTRAALLLDPARLP